MVPGAVPFEHQMKVCLPLDCYIYNIIYIYILYTLRRYNYILITILVTILITILITILLNIILLITIIILVLYLYMMPWYDYIYICTWLYVHEDDNRWCSRPNPEKCLSLPVACYNWYWNQPPLEWMIYAQWILSPQTCAAQCTRCAR